MEVNIAGREYCHLADYLFSEEQAYRNELYVAIARIARQNPYWPR